ncbi:hypothetical protein RJ640_024211 [Escallonia rubra]|uniref:Uncharacterized protein n=1 Tax=Escallonia rubra TaxID=112253 RepID=A0AA88RB92_9ASTE|nr:hypothetical protein RJ640_024211 [Escallonia rubra]
MGFAKLAVSLFASLATEHLGKPSGKNSHLAPQADLMAISPRGLTKMLGSKGWKGCTTLGKTDTREPAPGVVPVYVGEEGNKYNVPIEFFSSNRIKELLEKYEDEFEAGKLLSLPCSENDFETHPTIEIEIKDDEQATKPLQRQVLDCSEGLEQRAMMGSNEPKSS